MDSTTTIKVLMLAIEWDVDGIRWTDVIPNIPITDANRAELAELVRLVYPIGDVPSKIAMHLTTA